MTAHAMDRAIEALARDQHGAFTLRQAQQLGATSGIVRRRRDSGQWQQLSSTVGVLPSAPPTWHRQVMAAVLSLSGSAVSGLAAGHLLELEGYRPVRPELTVPRGTSRRSPVATVHQSDRSLTTQRGPFPVVTVEQALCDSAGRLGSARLESVLEAALFRILDDPRIPCWEAQAAPGWWPDADERVDVLIPPWRLIIEADGRRRHTRRADFENDRPRDHIALVHDHRTLRFTHQQLCHEPDYVLGGDPGGRGHGGVVRRRHAGTVVGCLGGARRRCS
jgi:hypothetical protein